jgi:hypothetical protein
MNSIPEEGMATVEEWSEYHEYEIDLLNREWTTHCAEVEVYLLKVRAHEELVSWVKSLMIGVMMSKKLKMTNMRNAFIAWASVKSENYFKGIILDAEALIDQEEVKKQDLTHKLMVANNKNQSLIYGLMKANKKCQTLQKDFNQMEADFNQMKACCRALGRPPAW